MKAGLDFQINQKHNIPFKKDDFKSRKKIKGFLSDDRAW